MPTKKQSAAARKGAAVTNAARRAKMEAEGRQPRAKGEPKLCLCGCQEMTKGGTFVMGHDARYKSALIKTALSRTDDPEGAEALEILESRGWTKFLDKARETAARPPRVRKTPAPQSAAELEQSAAERLQVLADLKEAQHVLESHGIHRKNSVTRFNFRSILDGTYPFKTLGWTVGQHCQIERGGVAYDGNIETIKGDRAKVQYEDTNGMITQVFELASLLEPRTDSMRSTNATPGRFR